MSKKQIYIVPKNATTHEILNLSIVKFVYISDTKTNMKFSYDGSIDTIVFKTEEDCRNCFFAIQGLLGCVEV